MSLRQGRAILGVSLPDVTVSVGLVGIWITCNGVMWTIPSLCLVLPLTYLTVDFYVKLHVGMGPGSNICGWESVKITISEPSPCLSIMRQVDGKHLHLENSSHQN